MRCLASPYGRHENARCGFAKVLYAWLRGQKEDSMAEKNRKKTYLILIAILIVVLLITYL